MTKLKVKVIARSGVVWEGEGDSCSMVNQVGPFDILVEHTQFVTPISGDIAVRNQDKITWTYHLDASALCRVKSNLVEIWLAI
ncbi:MAG: hypothetical protein WAV40_02620 [Microgenomates group bacterium]